MIAPENFELQNIPSEERCISILKEIKLKNGFVCTQCNSGEYYWKQDKVAFECQSCQKRFSLKVGTIMEGSQLPLHYWVVALHYRLNKMSEPLSSIQKKLNHNRYATIHEIVTKIDSQIQRQNPIVNSEFSDLIELESRVWSNKINFIFGDYNEAELQENLIFHYLTILSLKPIIY